MQRGLPRVEPLLRPGRGRKRGRTPTGRGRRRGRAWPSASLRRSSSARSVAVLAKNVLNRRGASSVRRSTWWKPAAARELADLSRVVLGFAWANANSPRSSARNCAQLPRAGPVERVARPRRRERGQPRRRRGLGRVPSERDPAVAVRERLQRPGRRGSRVSTTSFHGTQRRRRGNRRNPRGRSTASRRRRTPPSLRRPAS